MYIARRLKGLRPFSQLNHRDLLELSSDVEIKHFGSKHIIYQENEKQRAIFLILSGSIRLQTCWENLDTKILNFLGRGEVLGIETAFFGSPVYSHSAVSSEDVTALEIPLQVFRERFLSLPKLSQEVHLQITQRLLELQMDICLSHALVPYRVAQLLLRFLDHQSPTLGGRIQFPLNRVHIAQKIGSQSETVTRILSQWTKCGWISTVDHHIQILDRKALEKIRAHRTGKK